MSLAYFVSTVSILSLSLFFNTHVPLPGLHALSWILFPFSFSF